MDRWLRGKAENEAKALAKSREVQKEKDASKLRLLSSLGVAAPHVSTDEHEQACQEPAIGNQHDPEQEFALDVAMLPRVAVEQPLLIPLERCEGINVAAVAEAYNSQSCAPAVDASLVVQVFNAFELQARA